MSVLVLLAKSPIHVRDLATRLSEDLKCTATAHDVFPFGWIEAPVSEGALFDAAEVYLPINYYTTGSYPDELS